MRATSPVCNGILRFTFGATPADILVASMAAVLNHILVNKQLIFNFALLSIATQNVTKMSTMPTLCISKNLTTHN